MKLIRAGTLILLTISLCQSERVAGAQEPRNDARKITFVTVQTKSATITQQYACRIQSNRQIEVRAPEDGYLQEVAVEEGQAVKTGDVMFKFVPIFHQGKLDFELAELEIAQIEFNNVKRLFDNKAVSQDEVKLINAKLTKAKAKTELARAELSFSIVKAPFDGKLDRLPRQQGSFVLRGETLTNLYDNKDVRAYFKVPERRYFKYMAEPEPVKSLWKVELFLADNRKFPHTGKINAIEAKFNALSGDITFRADFPNPEGLLRDGQTGTAVMRREWQNVIVIPQQAAFENHSKWYVNVVDKDNISHQREIVILDKMEDFFVVKEGLVVGDKIVVDGLQGLRDGEKVKY